MRTTTLFFLSLLVITGCSCSDPETLDDDAGARDAATADAPAADARVADAYTPSRDADLGACGEPFEMVPDPAAEARAITALAALDPAASLTWVADRGTFSSITGLAIPIAECEGTDDAYDALLGVLEASPELFQIDRDEWRPDSAYPCSAVTDDVDFLRIRRVAYGPYALVNDVVSVAVQRREGVVTLFGFGGTYVPRADAALVAALEACADRSDDVVEALVRAQPFDYTRFEPPPADGCQPVAEGTYIAVASDVVTLASETTLLWDEVSPIRFRRLRTAILEVARANHTPELVQSDANCEIEGRRIGWIRTFDSITGEIISDIRTPVPGCIVC